MWPAGLVQGLNEAYYKSAEDLSYCVVQMSTSPSLSSVSFSPSMHPLLPWLVSALSNTTTC